MGYEVAKRSNETSRTTSAGATNQAIGKRTLVDEAYGEFDPPDAPLEAPAAGPLSSPRFAGDADLTAVAVGKKQLDAGATGIAVTKVQRALIDLGQALAATGTVDAATQTALKAFQTGKAIAGSGRVDKATMLALDAAFAGYGVEGAMLKNLHPSTRPTEGTPYPVGSAPKELLAGTHTPTADEKAAVTDALSTEVKADPKTGKLPAFKETVKGQKYGARIEAAVNHVLDGQLARAKDAAAERKAGHLYDWGDIEKVAVESKHAADASFGSYATGKPLKATGIDAKIKDAWEFKEKLLADPAESDGAAEWRVDKVLTGYDAVSTIDAEHGAIQTRAAEKAIIDAVRAKIVAARRADLLLIHTWWPGFADNGNIFIQRIQKTDPKTGQVDKPTGRSYMWQEFQTIIHEYIHTLEHPEHVKYRGGMQAQRGGFVLREGTTDYFTKIAFNNAPITDAVRASVEGPFHENGVIHPLPPLTTYRESANAERVAGIVGLPNLCGAFFLGQTELIGK
ncbi:MAG TPA: peptidoglycan-binding protein [Kofleriaceae bacterium]|nr:peptidoglycan-binding protein [Kofleriaceae bacterium]